MLLTGYPMSNGSFLQFHRPVGFADEPGPAFDPHSVRTVQRLPDRSDRWSAQRHLRLVRCPVRLTGIAVDARQYAVLPSGSSPLGSGQDVIDRQLLAPRLLVAILAGEPVSLEDIPSAERHHVRRESVVERQDDHFRYPQAVVLRTDDRFFFTRNQARPVGPVILLVIGRIDDPGGLVPNLHQRPGDGGDTDRLPVPVQDQSRSVQDCGNHNNSPQKRTHRVTLSFLITSSTALDPNARFGGG